MASKWTKEQIKFLKENAKRMNHKELTKAFNETFNLNRTERAISVKKTQYGIYRIKCTSKGHKPWHSKEIGSTRQNKRGYQEIKVSNKKWVYRHRYIYEQHYGKIPKNYEVIFLDGDKNNLDISNLTIVDKKTALTMMRKRLMFEDKELTKTGIAIASLMNKNKDLDRR